MRGIRVKQKRAKWMTTEIIDLIRQITISGSIRNLIYKLILINMCTNRNQARYHIQTAKTDYYAEAVTENIHQPKKLWIILKVIGAGKTNSNSCNTGIDIDNAICFDKKVISNHSFTIESYTVHSVFY